MSKTVAARQLADWTVDKVRTPAIPYVEGRRSAAGTDCINLIGWGLEELAGIESQRGSNSAWRKDMMWTGTIQEAKTLGYLIPGAIVYIKDPPTTKWPDGDYGHAGVYVGFEYGLKNPEGQPADVVHASQSREGVYGSILSKNKWSHVALHKGVDYSAAADDAYVASLLAKESPVTGIPASEQVTETNTHPSVPVAQTEPHSGEVMVVTKESAGVRLRKQPKIADGNVICEVPKGTILPNLEQRGGWTRVPYGIHEGWIRDDMLVFGGVG